MAINYPYDPSQLTEGETLYEELIKIRRYLNLNPIYKVYYINTAFVKGTFEYDYSLIVLSEGQEVSQNDVVIFNNYYFATVNSVEKLQDKTIITVTNVHLFALTGPQGERGPKGEQGPEGPKGRDGKDGEGSGDTTIYVNGVISTRQYVTDDLQSQFDYIEGDVARVDGEIAKLKTSVSANVDGIAHLNEIKQDKLAQVDLDNIASINQMKDDINAKQNKLSDTQLQAIGEIDAIKGIALDNQANKASKSEVTELASQVNTNANRLNNIKINIYTRPYHFNITEPCSTLDILNRKVPNTMYIISNDNYNMISDTPSGYGILEINVANNINRPSVKFTKEAGTGTTTVYIGNLTRDSIGFNNITWKEIVTK